MRHPVPSILALGAFCAVAFASPGRAGANLRCGNELVQPGDTKVEVLLACGEPLVTETVAVETDAEETEQIVERWTYDLGEGRLLKILVFVGGVLDSVENGERR